MSELHFLAGNLQSSHGAGSLAPASVSVSATMRYQAGGKTGISTDESLSLSLLGAFGDTFR